MDLTVLDLGLRNRQLLHVKCFLKIQVETFRFFLVDELASLKKTDRYSILEKFFVHDWQNVVNKIVSVAVVAMTGDYTSRLFAASLFRSLSQSCNQLMLIVSTIDLSHFDDHHQVDDFVFTRSLSQSSSSSHSSLNQDGSTTILRSVSIKKKIFTILVNIINSINDYLEKLHFENCHKSYFHYSQSMQQSLTESSHSAVKEEETFDSLCPSENFEAHFERSITDNRIPLLQVWRKTAAGGDCCGSEWPLLLEQITNHVSGRLKSNEITSKLIEEIHSCLAQTGLSSLYLLFKMFLQTCDAPLRQKLLKVFFENFDSVEELSESIRAELTTTELSGEDVNIGEYVRLMSIIDMYIFCFRLKLNDLQPLEMSIEWIVNLPDKTSLAKSLIIPVLEEVALHPDLFVDWRELNEQIFSHPLLHLHQYFIHESNFATLVEVDSLWQYWIDNGNVHSLTEWIQSGHTSLPYCSELAIPDDFDLCRRMVTYLVDNCPQTSRQKLLQILCCNSKFFHSFPLSKLKPEVFSFQKILSYFGQSESLSAKNEDGEICLDHLLNPGPSFELPHLIDYCVQHELYEFLYYLHGQYRSQFEQISSSLSDKSSSIIKFLIDSNPLEDECEDYIFNKSIRFYLFLAEEKVGIHSSLERLIYNQKDVEIILLMLAFSSQRSFDDLSNTIKLAMQTVSVSDTCCSALNSQYPLIWKCVETVINSKFNEEGSVSTLSTSSANSVLLSTSNTGHSASTLIFDIYSLLQQSIHFVDIGKFFNWQIKRRLGKLRNKASILDSSLLPKQTELSLENCELPHFSQKRLTELYGLQAELTVSYYLKNFRLIEAFVQFFKLRLTAKARHSRHKEKYNSLSGKLSIKAIRKSILVVYNSIRQNSILVSCLLFQSLVRFCCLQGGESEKAESVEAEIGSELRTTSAHLAIGKLIMEYTPDYLSLQGVQQQQSALASLLRKSHFNGDRCSAQKLLDLATVAIERKFTSPFAPQDKFNKNVCIQSIVNIRLHSLLENSCPAKQRDTTKPDSVAVSQHCLLLLECFEWKAIFHFAKLHDLARPLDFLSKCAQVDNWLVFTIFTQMYEIPKEEFQKFLRDSNFNNQCIGEHLSKAFQSSARVNANLLNTDSRLVKLKQMPDSSRNDLYSRLFRGGKIPTGSNVRKPPEVGSPGSPLPGEGSVFAIDTESVETLSVTSTSIFSKLSDDSGSSSNVLFEQQLSPDLASKDLLQLILEIYQNCVYFESRASGVSFCFEKSFFNSLLYASISLSNPVLALLACSLCRGSATPVIEIKHSRTTFGEKSFDDSKLKFKSFCCWILASVGLQSRQNFIDWSLNGNHFEKNDGSKASLLAQCYLHWTPNRVLYLVDVLTQNDAHNLIILSRALHIFNLQIKPLEKLLEFLIRFFIEKDYYQSNGLLQESQSLLLNYREEESVTNTGDDSLEDPLNTCCSLRTFYTRNWIEKCCVTLITNSILLAQQFELAILLSYYNCVRLQETFSQTQDHVPDIKRLYLFSQCLAKLPNFSLPISKLLFPDYERGAEESGDHHYVNTFRKLIFDLQEAGHFDEARNIITLLPKAKTNEFIINEWMLKAKKAETSSEVTLESNGSVINKIDLEFWENCWIQVTKLDPTMHSAFKVMERFVQKLEPSQILIKCFVLIKSMLAVETILINYLDSEMELEFNTLDDSSLSSENAFSNNLDLVQDFDQFEFDLWKCALECEHCILVGGGEECGDSPSVLHSESLDTSIYDSWATIWQNIVGFVKSSKFSSQIIPRLSLKYSYLYKTDKHRQAKISSSFEVTKRDALSRLVGRLLNSFCYKKACHVAELFAYTHDDFELIKACDNAAKGLLADISETPLSLQLKIQNSDLKNVSSDSFSSFSAHKLSLEQKHTINMIETFHHFATIGKKTCEFILLYYKISCILDPNSANTSQLYTELSDPANSTMKLFERLISCEQMDGSVESDGESEDLKSGDDGSVANSGDYTQSLINRYVETINCAKELIRISGDEDECRNSEEKIVDTLSKYVLNNVQFLVEQQFKKRLSPNLDSAITEIELDKTQLAFNSSRFLVLIKILHEPSLLGHKLISVCRKEKSKFENKYSRFLARKTTFDLEESSLKKEPGYLEFLIHRRKNYVLLVELYIRAHECFTIQCDVRGIALVLRKIRLLITQELQTSRYFHLILRLLTGIGRYSEMTYCFDLFRECDQFEMILSKRVQRTPQLRIALLNYLKTAENLEELLPLVAIRFFLFRETADYHRTRAEKLLAEVINQYSCAVQVGSTPAVKFNISVNLSSSLKRMSSSSLVDFASNSPVSSTTFSHGWVLVMRDHLEAIMYEFQEAECNYTKASSHTNADQCSRKAQLVALQIGYLDRSKPSESSQPTQPNITFAFILCFDQSQLREFIYSCTNFYEALIVARGYPDINIDWLDPFFNNVIIGSNQEYLSQYASANTITVAFLNDLVKRYDQLVANFKQQQQNRSARLELSTSSQLSNSPSSLSFNLLMGQVKSQFELQRMRRIMEQLLEHFLCNSSDNSKLPSISAEWAKFTLKERYTLAKKFNSQRIMERLLEADCENCAYLLDLNRNQRL